MMVIINEAHPPRPIAEVSVVKNTVHGNCGYTDTNTGVSIRLSFETFCL